MKRFALIVSCVWLIVGCSDSQPTAKTDQSNVVTQQANQAETYVKKLAELRVQAQSLESEMQFADAANVWQQIEKQVISAFGANSWQAINAKIAHKSSTRKSELTTSHSAELNQIAVLQEKIKSAYVNERHQQALELSQRLLSLQEPLLGDVSMETARVKLQIGTLQNQLGIDDPALKNLHDAVEVFRAKGIELHPELQSALATLADIYTQQQKYRPAVANQKAATQLAGHLWGTDSLQYANQANQLGVIFHRAGNQKVAYDILKTAKRIREKKQGAQSLEYAHSCLNLGVVSLGQQKLDEAQQLLLQARTIFGEKLGMDHELSIRCNAQLATVTMLQNRPELAEKLLHEVVATGSSSIAPSQLADYKYKLAIAMAHQGKYDSAEPMLQGVLGQQKTVHGATSTQVAGTLRALAKVYEATHQKSKLDSIRKQLNRITTVASGNDFQRRY